EIEGVEMVEEQDRLSRTYYSQSKHYAGATYELVDSNGRIIGGPRNGQQIEDRWWERTRQVLTYFDSKGGIEGLPLELRIAIRSFFRARRERLLDFSIVDFVRAAECLVAVSPSSDKVLVNGELIAGGKLFAYRCSLLHHWGARQQYLKSSDGKQPLDLRN